MKYVGIDVHKKMCQAAVLDEDGELLEQIRFANLTWNRPSPLASQTLSIGGAVMRPPHASCEDLEYQVCELPIWELFMPSQIGQRDEEKQEQ